MAGRLPRDQAPRRVRHRHQPADPTGAPGGPSQAAPWGNGIYCTPTLETKQFAMSFTYDGHEVQVIFMNRVNPKGFKRASANGGPDDVWVVEDPKDIRPYKILVRILSVGNNATDADLDSLGAPV